MKEILDAIQSPESTSADFAALPLPESYRAITVHKDETEMFAASTPGTRTPASRSTWTTCRSPNSARARRSWPSWPAP